MYSEKATKFCEIYTLLLAYVVPVKKKVKISQNFVAFSEYMNFSYVRKIYIIWDLARSAKFSGAKAPSHSANLEYYGLEILIFRSQILTTFKSRVRNRRK